MKIIIEEDDLPRAARLLRTEDSFALLWEIDQHCRSTLKYGDVKSYGQALEEIRSMIAASHLIALYI